MKNTGKHTAPNLLVCLEEPLTQTPLATPPDQVESFFLTGRKIQAQTYDWIFLEESNDRDRKKTDNSFRTINQVIYDVM